MWELWAVVANAAAVCDVVEKLANKAIVGVGAQFALEDERS